jgi:hypothetical protein
MRRTLVTIFALVLLAGPMPVRAEEAEATHCTFEFEVVLSPGFSMSPSSGTHRSGAPGTLECKGLVNGQQPTGTGTLGEEGRYGTKDGDTCTSGGEGDGVDTLRVPTAAGFETVVSEFTFTFGDLSTKGGVVSGKFEGTRFTGTFDFTPTQGDCVTAPVTKARVFGEGVVHG